MSSSQLAFDEALRAIWLAIDAGETRLNLSSGGALRVIPSEIGKLSPTELTVSSREDFLDISALGALETLERLTIHGSAQVDLAQLGRSPALQRLELATPSVSNLHLLGSFPLLRALELRGMAFVAASDALTVLNALVDLPELRELRLPDGYFEDPKILAQFTQLESLHLNGVMVQDPYDPDADWGIPFDVSILRPLKRLRELNLYEAEVETITALVDFPNLRSLNIGRNPVQDHQVLAEMRELEEIYLADVPMKDISILSGMVELRTLWAPSEPARQDIAWLTNMPVMQDLALAVDGANLEPLLQLPKLKALSLYVHGVQDLSVVGKLQQLENLSLSGYPVEDLSALSGLKGLKTLRLHRTSVRDLDPVKGVASLKITGS